MKNPPISRKFLTGFFSKIPSWRRLAAAAALAVSWACWAAFSPEIAACNAPAEVRPPPQTSSDFSAAKTAIRLCTWNVHNYNVSGRRVGGAYAEVPKPEAEKVALRKALASISADVVIIQEMGDAAFLSELQADLARDNAVYGYAFLTSQDSPSRLAMLSRIKPEKIFDFGRIEFDLKGEGKVSARGTLGAEFVTNGVRWRAFAVHLKSAVGARKRDENFIPFRFAELRAIDGKIASAGLENIPVIVAGDFNQEGDCALLGNISRMRLSPLAQEDSQGKSYTFHWRKKEKFLTYDFMLISPEAAKYAPPKAIVFSDAPDASDHRPVYADFDFSDKNKL